MVRHKHYGINRTLMVCLVIIFLLTFPGCTDMVPVTTPPEPTESVKPPATQGPTFTVSKLLIMPTEVKIRDDVGISVLVTNSGDETGNHRVSLEINGRVVASKEITLASGASDMVIFRTSQESPGNYQVNVDGCRGMFVVIPPPQAPLKPPQGAKPGKPTPGPLQPDKPKQPSLPSGPTAHSDWTIPTGSGTNYRAVHMGGNWGTNRTSVPYLPVQSILYLRDLNVNWVGISVALHIDGSMDSTVELNYDEHLQIPTFRDEVLREMISAFRRHGFNVYIHMAFESGAKGEHPVKRWQLGDPFAHSEDPDISPEYWPWRTDHPQHQSFVAEFWRTYADSVVHVARIAEEEGVGMLTLGTETDRLFRSRAGGQWPNHFLNEMKAMVSAVRDVYRGQLSYEMHYGAVVERSFFGPGSDYLVDDIDLDFIAVSAYFQLMQSVPSNMPTVQDLEARWNAIFNEHLKPLKQRNRDRPLVFTEFGYVDSKEALRMASADEFTDNIFKDKDGNNRDDGEEVQANAYAAFFNTMDRYPGIVDGAFLWDVMMSTQQEYQQSFAKMRTFNIRGKLAEGVVREHYAGWR